MSAVDVKNFGATYAESGNNISITGAVQIGQGFNVYEDSEAQEQQILSPFRDASEKKKRKKERQKFDTWNKIVSDEAHYLYPFLSIQWHIGTYGIGRDRGVLRRKIIKTLRELLSYVLLLMQPMQKRDVKMNLLSLWRQRQILTCQIWLLIFHFKKRRKGIFSRYLVINY